MEALAVLIIIAISYLLGSVPFGLIYARALTGIDIRSIGSGNIGATNVLRAAGKKAAALTLAADMLKGMLPVLAVRYWMHDGEFAVLAGIAAVLGHNFPVYLSFKGGKGVATSFGVMLAMTPKIGAVCLLIWLAVAILWRYSSLAALISFAAYPVLVIALYSRERAIGALGLFLAGLIYIRHRENIKRLMAGTESKIGSKSTGIP